VENAPTCVNGSLALKGMLDGQPLDAQAVLDTRVMFQQVQQPYTFDVTYAYGAGDNMGSMHLEWTTLLPVDAPPVSVTGTVDMPAGVSHDGERLCAGGGEIQQVDLSDGGGTMTEFHFTLEMLSWGYGCAAGEVAGRINGCIKG
jgi:hypothetical protein